MQSEFGDSVTIYNRRTQGGTILWRRALLSGVAVVDCRGEAMRHSGAASSSARRTGPVSIGELTAIIPCAGREGYRTPMEWRLLAGSETEGWTLQPGDLLVPGDCFIELGEDTAALLEQCDRVAVIGAVTALGAGGELAHWEVSAR